MSTVISVPPAAASAASPDPPPLYRLTVDEYERIIAAGALDEPGKVELIDGYLVTKMAKSPEHSFSTKEVLKAVYQYSALLGKLRGLKKTP